MGTCCSSSQKPQAIITPEQTPKPLPVTKLGRNHTKWKQELDDDVFLEAPISHRPTYTKEELKKMLEELRKKNPQAADEMEKLLGHFEVIQTEADRINEHLYKTRGCQFQSLQVATPREGLYIC